MRGEEVGEVTKEVETGSSMWPKFASASLRGMSAKQRGRERSERETEENETATEQLRVLVRYDFDA